MSDLIELEKINAVDLFAGNGIDKLLDMVRKEALAQVPDTTTAKGRAAITKNATKIVKTRTYLDAAGKGLVDGMKAQCRVIDGNRKTVKDTLLLIQAEAVKPLTEYKEAEEFRKTAHETAIREIIVMGEDCRDNWLTADTGKLRASKATIEGADRGESWEEYQTDAIEAIDNASMWANQAIRNRDLYDEEQAELARLKAADEARQADELAEKHRAEGEQRVKDESEAAAKKVVDDAAALVQKTKDDAELLLKNEREKVANQEKEAQGVKDREAEQAAALLRNTQHKGRINKAAVQALMKTGIDEDQATKIVKAIVRGQIPAVSISYQG